MDEGIAIGISSNPLSEMPGLLRQDASPPFYYLMLHVWMSVLGDSESGPTSSRFSSRWGRSRLRSGQGAAWIALGLSAAVGLAAMVGRSWDRTALAVIATGVIAAAPLLAQCPWSVRCGHSATSPS
jgi:uncharacterized membrane protein